MLLTHEELLKLWTEDSAMDSTSIRETMYSHPMLHSKYLTFLQAYQVNHQRQLRKYKKLRALKTKYYNGEMVKEELDLLGWKQYLNKKPLKSELDVILSGDSDLQELEEKIVYSESMVKVCESIMKDISNRYFLFRSLVDYEKHLAGV